MFFPSPKPCQSKGGCGPALGRPHRSVHFQDDPHKGPGSPEPPSSSPAFPLMRRGRPLRPGSAHRLLPGKGWLRLPGQGPAQSLKLGGLECLSGNLTVGFGNHSLHKGAEHSGRLRREVPLEGAGGWGKLQSRLREVTTLRGSPPSSTRLPSPSLCGLVRTKETLAALPRPEDRSQVGHWKVFLNVSLWGPGERD